MRLFVAIALSENMKKPLLRAISELRNVATQGNFTKEENLHLTLAFIGEVSTSRVADAKRALDKVSAHPFTLALDGGIGRFVRSGGDIYYANVGGGNALLSLASDVKRELTAAEFAIEERAFRPHITLGREVTVSSPVSSISIEPASMTVSHFGLYKSERIAGKLTYTEIHRIELLPR
ncbi:MAG: RNA 2',3'-cyclic phosphodiesterase [Eubacteriales bacterium]|jgi:2'-5' RNA ligase|nr:RNA 2',3'-cyclic phosphodiesterase [Clostridiales bacterium]